MKDAQIQILKAHNELVHELKDSFKRLETILLSDVEHRKDINQLQKDVDGVGEKLRFMFDRVDLNTTFRTQLQVVLTERRLEELQKFNAEEFKEATKFIMSERSWRKIFPFLFALASFALSVFALIEKFHTHGGGIAP